MDDMPGEILLKILYHIELRSRKLVESMLKLRTVSFKWKKIIEEISIVAEYLKGNKYRVTEINIGEYSCTVCCEMKDGDISIFSTHKGNWYTLKSELPKWRKVNTDSNGYVNDVVLLDDGTFVLLLSSGAVSRFNPDNLVVEELLGPSEILTTVSCVTADNEGNIYLGMWNYGNKYWVTRISTEGNVDVVAGSDCLESKKNTAVEGPMGESLLLGCPHSLTSTTFQGEASIIIQTSSAVAVYNTHSTVLRSLSCSTSWNNAGNILFWSNCYFSYNIPRNKEGKLILIKHVLIGDEFGWSHVAKMAHVKCSDLPSGYYPGRYVMETPNLSVYRLSAGSQSKQFLFMVERMRFNL